MAIQQSTDIADVFRGHILLALRKAVESIAEEEVRLAQDRIEKRVRDEVATLAIRVAEWAEVSMLRDRIVIEVKTDKFKVEP